MFKAVLSTSPETEKSEKLRFKKASQGAFFFYAHELVIFIHMLMLAGGVMTLKSEIV